MIIWRSGIAIEMIDARELRLARHFAAADRAVSVPARLSARK